MTPGTNDPYESAMNVEYNPSKSYFGQAAVDVWHCVLVKGQGKLPFDPGVHKREQRCTAVDITISPLPGSKTTYDVKRELIAESKEWGAIIKPSLVALGADLRGIDGRYVRVERVSTGHKYTNKQGEEKESLTIKFTAVYPDAESCQAAADAFFGSRQSTDGGSPEPQAQGASVAADPNDKERNTALLFLPSLWKMAGNDFEKFAALLAKNPLTAKYFTLNSEEVIKVVQEAA